VRGRRVRINGLITAPAYSVSQPGPEILAARAGLLLACGQLPVVLEERADATPVCFHEIKNVARDT
jgi:hypothetical protein